MYEYIYVEVPVTGRRIIRFEVEYTSIRLDVFDIEPLPADSPWRNEDWDAEGRSRVLLTPHMGYVEEGTLTIWYEETAENLERLVAGDELHHRIL